MRGSDRHTKRGERGASFLLALVMLLVCAVVVTVVVTAAASSVERSKVDVTEQQAYYAVSSGIKAARSLCDESGPVADLVLTRQGQNGQLEAGSTSDGSGLATWAAQSANAIAQGGSPSGPYEAEIDAFTVGSAQVPAVKLTYTMASSGANQYAITIKAQLAEGDDYATVLSTTVPATVSGGTSGDLTVVWKEAS